MTLLHFVIGLGVFGGITFLITAAIVVVSIERVELRDANEQQQESEK